MLLIWIVFFYVVFYFKSKFFVMFFLKKILEDLKIIKVGVWVMGDVSKV